MLLLVLASVTSIVCNRVVVDAEVSGVQQRNLEAAWGCPVIDRVGLIIKIFAQRAHTREARLQVYTLSFSSAVFDVNVYFCLLAAVMMSLQMELAAEKAG